MHFGAWICLSAWAVSGLLQPSRGACALLSCKPGHVALSQTFLAEGWMSLSDTPGSPHSHTHVGQEGKITLRAAEWTAGQFHPSASRIPWQFPGQLCGCKTWPRLFSTLFDQGCFLCCLTELPCNPTLLQAFFLVPISSPGSLAVATSDSPGTKSLKPYPILSCYSQLTLW